MSKAIRAARTKVARARKKLNDAEFFFYQHAGYSYGPNETSEQGRIRSAKQLAEAERTANERNWMCRWKSDWSIGSHVKEFDTYDAEPSTCECCSLHDEDGYVLASLGCIDDADSNYRRVIEAELAAEALGHERAEQQRDAEVERMIGTTYAL